MEGEIQHTHTREQGDNECLINFRNNEWRREQFEACERIVSDTFKEAGEKIGDDFFIRVTEDYNPNKEEGYSLRIYAESSKVDQVRINYHPLKHNVEWYRVFVNDDYRKQGIGTVLEGAVELTARRLGADSLTLRNIVDSSLEYWRNKPGVVFDETGKNATKQLS